MHILHHYTAHGGHRYGVQWYLSWFVITMHVQLKLIGIENHKMN